METVSDNQSSCQTNDMSVNINANATAVMADQNGGGDADKSPGRGDQNAESVEDHWRYGGLQMNATMLCFFPEKDTVGTAFEHIGQGESSKDGEVAESSSPR